MHIKHVYIHVHVTTYIGGKIDKVITMTKSRLCVYGY